MKNDTHQKTFFQMYISLWKVLPKNRRHELLVIIFVTIITSFTEFLSIGAVIPFLAALMNPEVIFEHDLLQSFFALLSIKNPEDVVPVFTFGFIAITISSNGLRFYLVRKSIKFNLNIGGDLGVKIYKNTLYQTYEEHTLLNSSVVISGIVEKVNSVVSNIFSPVLTIFTSLVMLIGVVSIMIYVNAAISIAVLLGFSTIYFLTLSINKKRLVGLGTVLDREKILLVKSLQEGFGGIREVIIDGTQDIYSGIFHSADLKIRRAQAQVDIIATIPKFIVETAAISLIVLVSYYMQFGENFQEIVPIMGMFAISGQRLMPLLQQIYVSIASIKSGNEIFKSIDKLLNLNVVARNANCENNSVEFNNEISLNNLFYGYKNSKVPILRDITFKIKKGSKIGIIGATGCGKSTLIDVIMGLLIPKGDKIKIDGIELSVENSSLWRCNVAHVPQSIYLSDSTISENIAFGIPKCKIDFNLVKKSAEMAFIDQTIESMDGKYDAIVGERGVRLSGGQRQRIGIARALYKQANLIVLDEATSALDLKTEAKVIGSFNKIKGNITMIIVAHRLSTLENCDVIIELSEGQIIKVGSYEEVVLNNEV